MRYRPIPSFVPADRPIADLNTTPLIDVMLVLLIMFILTMPTMTHKVGVDLPNGPGPIDPRTIYRLDLDAAGQIHWNGSPVAEASLPARLAAVRADEKGELHLAAAGAARYEDYDRILADVKRAGISRLGLVGNDAFARELDR